MTPEERMLERFTKERQRASKGAVFNLEEEDELTHYGQSLSHLDDFDDVGLGLDEDDEDDGMYMLIMSHSYSIFLTRYLLKVKSIEKLSSVLISVDLMRMGMKRCIIYLSHAYSMG